MNIIFYAHGGSYNHGCEAIIRGTTTIFGKENEYILYSLKKEEDLEYKLNEIVDVKSDICDIKSNKFSYIFYCLKYKLFKNDVLYYQQIHKKMYKECSNKGVAFSVGGDNYCYNGLPERMAEYNSGFNKHGVKTILWGCSIEPSLLNSTTVKEDLNRYSLIVARESITYNALKENGIKNVLLYPDPAFALEKDENFILPKEFGKEGIIGINVSPLVENIAGNIVMQNYYRLIEEILSNTKLDIMLLPHVVWDDLDDRKSLNSIYSYFNKSKRILYVGDTNCCKLKGYIGKCKYFVGARTHATIAAYSQMIPTLVVGYSVKSKGIAKDLFGSYENYVISVQDMTEKDDLTRAFKWIMSNEDKIKEKLNKKIPQYKESLKNVKTIILDMVKENDK